MVVCTYSTNCNATVICIICINMHGCIYMQASCFCLDCVALPFVHPLSYTSTALVNCTFPCYCDVIFFTAGVQTFANYTAWKWRLEKKNHDLAAELTAYALTSSFSYVSHLCGHDSSPPITVYNGSVGGLCLGCIPATFISRRLQTMLLETGLPICYVNPSIRMATDSSVAHKSVPSRCHYWIAMRRWGLAH